MFISIALGASLALAQPQGASRAEPQETPTEGAVAPEESPYRALVRAAREAGEPRARDEEPDQIRLMMRTDVDDSRFFNRPGATRAEFDVDWEHCRQIGRRLARQESAGGSYALPHNPVLHPGLAGAIGYGIGGGIGAALNQAMAERRARRDIRRYCLVTRGWRMVEPDEAHRRRIASMPRAERRAYIDSMIGAESVEGATLTDLASYQAKEEKEVEEADS